VRWTLAPTTPDDAALPRARAAGQTVFRPVASHLYLAMQPAARPEHGMARWPPGPGRPGPRDKAVPGPPPRHMARPGPRGGPLN
jgi:hypothetical protein